MHKIIITPSAVILDMDEFIETYVKGDSEDAECLREAYRKLERECPHYVLVEDPDELTDEEHQRLLDCMLAVGGFGKALENCGIYAYH